MRTPRHPEPKSLKTIREKSLLADISVKFDPLIAGPAIVDGLNYLKNRLGWSGNKIANTLHLPPNTLNGWIKNGNIPINSAVLHPDIQAILHLLAIHRSLEAMFENPEHQVKWLSTMHPELNVIPEELMGKS